MVSAVDRCKRALVTLIRALAAAYKSSVDVRFRLHKLFTLNLIFFRLPIGGFQKFSYVFVCPNYVGSPARVRCYVFTERGSSL